MLNLKGIMNYDENDFISRMFFIYFSLLNMSVGTYLVMMPRDSNLVINAMSKPMPLTIWGYLLILSGILYALAAFQENKSKHYLMLSAGFMAAILYALYAMATVEQSPSILSALRFAFMAGFNLIIALVGGISLWRQRQR